MSNFLYTIHILITEAMKRFLIWGSAILGMILLVVLLANLGSSSAPKTTIVQPVAESDQKKGPDSAAVTLVEYSDFQCPACAQYYPMLKQLSEEFPEDVQIVYRHYPLRTIHKHAEKAAHAAEAAGKQGKFWDMHDMLFNTQRVWGSADNPEEQFEQYAGSLSLNIEQFKQDMVSAEVKEKVRNDEMAAIGMNLRGTPTFFLNNTLIPNPQSYDQLKAMVSQYINN